MRKLALLIPVALLVAVAAHGGEQYQAALSSSDAGSSNTASVKRFQNYALQCANPACFKLGSVTPLAADCSQDFNVDRRITGNHQPDAGAVGYYVVTVPAKHEHRFNAGGASFIVARALDGGSPACNVYLDN